MEPISNAERLAMVLRQKLQERAKSAGGRAAGSKSDAPVASPATGLQALKAVEGADERQLRRGLIQALLAEEFGSALINDAQFQQIVSRVTETIERDDQATNLLSQVLSSLR